MMIQTWIFSLSRCEETGIHSNLFSGFHLFLAGKASKNKFLSLLLKEILNNPKNKKSGKVGDRIG